MKICNNHSTRDEAVLILSKIAYLFLMTPFKYFVESRCGPTDVMILKFYREK